MKVVVTGATGRLGRHVVPVLRGVGHEVLALGHGDPATGGDVIDLDRDGGLEHLRAQLGPEVVVIHLAARTPIDPARTVAADRRALVYTNVHGTLRVLEACRDHGAALIVFASTLEVEPVNVAVAHRAGVHRAPTSDFVATKLAGEDHLRVLELEAGIPSVIVRFPDLGAPDARARAAAELTAAVAGAQVVRGDPPDGRPS